MSVFEELNALNVNEHSEKKKSGDTMLTYLSWTWAWAEVKKRYEDAQYEIVMHDGLPYVYDENTGYMVFTNVTIDGITHCMWLPVMDSNNRAMKSKPYDLTFKSGKSITVAPATMFDINKTIMRCLVKNLAMFGLGLYIYAGEDLPQAEVEEIQLKKMAEEKAQTLKSINEVVEVLKKEKIDIDLVLELYKVDDVKNLKKAHCDNIMKHLEDIKKKQEDRKNEQSNS